MLIQALFQNELRADGLRTDDSGSKKSIPVNFLNVWVVDLKPLHQQSNTVNRPLREGTRELYQHTWDSRLACPDPARRA